MNEELLISLVQQYKELYDLEDPQYHDEQRRMNIWQEIGGILNESPYVCKDKWKRIRDNYRRAKKLRRTKSGQAAKKTKPIRHEKELEFLSAYISYDAEEILTNLSDDDDELSVSSASVSGSQVMSPPYASGSQAMSPPYASGSQTMSPPYASGLQVMSPPYASGTQVLPPASSSRPPVMSSAPASGSSSKAKYQASAVKKKRAISPQKPTPTHALFQSYLEKKYQHNITQQKSANQEHDTVVDFFTNLGHTVKTFPRDLQIRIKGAVFKIVNDAEAEVVSRQEGSSSDNVSVLRTRIRSSSQPLRIYTQNQDTISAQGSASIPIRATFQPPAPLEEECEIQDSDDLSQFLRFPKNK